MNSDDRNELLNIMCSYCAGVLEPADADFYAVAAPADRDKICILFLHPLGHSDDIVAVFEASKGDITSCPLMVLEKFLPPLRQAATLIVKEWAYSVSQKVDAVPLHVTECLHLLATEENAKHLRFNVPNSFSVDPCWYRDLFRKARAFATDPNLQVPSLEHVFNVISSMEWISTNFEIWYDKEKNIDMCRECAKDQTPEMLEWMKMKKFCGTNEQLILERGIPIHGLTCNTCSVPVLTVELTMRANEAVQNAKMVTCFVTSSNSATTSG